MLENTKSHIFSKTGPCHLHKKLFHNSCSKIDFIIVGKLVGNKFHSTFESVHAEFERRMSIVAVTLMSCLKISWKDEIVFFHLFVPFHKFLGQFEWNLFLMTIRN